MSSSFNVCLCLDLETPWEYGRFVHIGRLAGCLYCIEEVIVRSAVFLRSIELTCHSSYSRIYPVCLLSMFEGKNTGLTVWLPHSTDTSYTGIKSVKRFHQ